MCAKRFIFNVRAEIYYHCSNRCLIYMVVDHFDIDHRQNRQDMYKCNQEESHLYFDKLHDFYKVVMFHKELMKYYNRFQFCLDFDMAME